MSWHSLQETPSNADEITIPGWNKELGSAFSVYKGPYIPGRVVSRHKTVWEILIPGTVIKAGISGALSRTGKQPVVGDFVVLLEQMELNSHIIINILPRRTCLSRGSAGNSSEEQVIAANIDTIFIVTSAGKDLSLRRLERYLTVVYSSGAKPVIVLNKADLTDRPSETVDMIRSIAADVPVIAVSALSRNGIEGLEPYICPDKTVALVGSSGVGKSTLINAFFNEPVQLTQSVREDDEKGRHTTTVRQLFVLPGGGVIIDNPGIREIQLGDYSDGFEKAFSDIILVAHNCHFKDCTHQQEPGCAVKKAVAEGVIEGERLESYHALNAELAFQSEKADIGLKRLEKKKYKGMQVSAREYREYKERR